MCVCVHHAALRGHRKGCSAFQTDPFRSVSQLSEEEKETARNQSVPSLLQLLNLAKQHSVSVIFDLYSPNQGNDTVDTVNTILNSGIDPSLASRILFGPTNMRCSVKRRILLRCFFFLRLFFAGPLASSRRTRVREQDRSRLRPGLRQRGCYA